MLRTLSSASLAPLLVLAACGDAPRPVAGPPPSPSREMPPGHPGTAPELPPGHPEIGRGMPAGHPDVGDVGEPAVFRGRVLLTGPLAGIEEGVVFVSAYAPGTRTAYMSMRILLGDESASRVEDGVRVLDFELSPITSHMGGNLPPDTDVEIEARYDPDGILETQAGVEKARVAARPGAEGLSIALPAGS